MSKKKLFNDDSDEEEVSLKTENEYAKKYDNWREKEEIHKLEQKYGSKVLDGDVSSSDSEDDSDEPPEVSEEMETQFLKTLALLKTKDPRIYDPSFKFFDEKEDKPQENFLESEKKTKTLTFADSDDDDDDDENIFTIEKKAEVDKEPNTKKNSEHTSKEGKLKDFLTGKAEHIEDDVEKDLEPLKAFWSNPDLNEGEAFLRDYILNKRYLEAGDGDGGGGEAGGVDRLRDDEELEADARLVEEQGKFERAYNFRFEEPDDEYLKRYPRTMNSIRPKDDRRSRKRLEIRTRKEEEKKKKMEEIARLKALKLKEIREKIARIKEVTGNQELAFKEEDIEGDFDPAEHDRRMRAIFDEEYYGQADGEKPVFPDLDDELEIENWENYDKNVNGRQDADDDEAEPHCEDEDFNMDADYDPKLAREKLLDELARGKKRRNRKRKSKLAQLLETEKPTFVPQEERSYAQFMEEYYALDCEDVVGGDLPTRFKYRQTVPNDYGLSVEEILLADDKELTQWVPLKKIVKYRPENVEKSEVNTYKQKAADVNLKRKMLPSLFKDLPEEPEVVIPVKDSNKKKRKKKKDKDKSESDSIIEENEQSNGNEETLASVDVTPSEKKKSKKKKKKHKDGDDDAVVVNGDDVDVTNKYNDKKLNVNHEDISSGVEKNTIQENDTGIIQNDSENSVNPNVNNVIREKKKKTRAGSLVVETIGSVEPSQSSQVITKVNQMTERGKKRTNSESKANNLEQTPIPTKKKNHKNKDPVRNRNINAKNGNKIDLKMKFKSKDKVKQAVDRPTHPFSNLSDERLKAYGLNPKKYKNFLKYKKY